MTDQWNKPIQKPDDGQDVLYVIKTDGEVIAGRYMHGYYIDNAGNGHSASAEDVSCWMPSPEIPDWAKNIF